MRLRTMAGALALLVAGCAVDPADQPPVELLPGLYELFAGGGTIVELASDKRSDQVCFWPADASTFPGNPLYRTVGDWPGCSDTLDEPRGNAMSGKRQCLERKMPMTVAYSGSHTTDSFEIHGTVTQGNDENASIMHLGSGEFTIIGKRIGDCTA